MKQIFTYFALLPFAIVAVGFYIYCISAQFMGVGGPFFSALFRGSMDVAALFGLLLLKKNVPVRKNLYFEFLVQLFAVVCFLNWYFVTGQSKYGLKKLGFLTIIAVFPFFMTKLVLFSEQHRKFINIMACLSLLLSISSIVVYHLGYSFEIAKGRFTIVEGFNTIYSALVSGVAVIWIWWMGFWKQMGSVKKAIWLVLISSISLYAMYLSGSRGPILSLFLAMFLFPPMGISLVSMKKLLLVVVLAIIMVVTLVYVPNEMARQRFGRMFSGSRITKTGRLDTIGQRKNRFHIALRNGYDHVLFGVGLGNTPEKHYAHNSFLEVWEELGLLGAVFYFLMFGGCFGLILRRRLSFRKPDKGLLTEPALWFWETIFFYAFFEGLVSMTMFANSLLWVAMGMVVMHCNAVSGDQSD